MNPFRWLGRLLTPPGWSVVEQAQAQPQAPAALPAKVTLGDTEVLLRLLEPGDGPAILDFATQLSPHDLLFLRRDITRTDDVDAWLRESAEGLVTTIVAVAANSIVGFATVASDGLVWTRHVRELHVMVGQSMRGKRLGRLLTEQAFAVAKEQGAKKMMAQMTVDQQAAMAVFQSMGFQPEAKLRGQVIDRDGQLHDLQIMSLDVDAFEAKLEVILAANLPPA